MSTARIIPEPQDNAVLALAVGDRGTYGTNELGNFDLGAAFPLLSAAGKAWFRQSTPDAVLRGALNCWWAAAESTLEAAQRKAEAESWYYARGAALRARIIARQDAERERT